MLGSKIFRVISALMLFNLLCSAGIAQNPVRFQERPQNLQLYTRMEDDSAAVTFKGEVTETGYDSIILQIYKDEERIGKLFSPLQYNNGIAEFSFAPKIAAGLYEYNFILEVTSGDNVTQVFSANRIVCGDAFIVNGQSNAHYASAEADFQSTFCRTFGVKTGMANYNPYDAADTLWALSQGSSSTGAGVGTLGIFLQKYILDEYQMPTCIINGGTGGSIIEEHLPNQSNPADLNSIYGKVLYRVQKAELQKIQAIIWYQGESDSDPDKTALYADRFGALYNNWMNDYQPGKIYVFQIRPGCGGSVQGAFRDTQRRLPQTLEVSNLSLMATVGLPGHDGCHYNLKGYETMAAWLYNLIRVDFYGSPDTLNIYPPHISEAVYEPGSKEIVLRFDQNSDIVWPDDSLGNALKDYIYLDGDFGMIKNGRASDDSVILSLNGSHFIENITYLPDVRENSGSTTYEGPWLRNARGIGALSFHKIHIQNPEKTIKVTRPNGGEFWSPNSYQTVEWNSTNMSGIRLEYSLDDGVSWKLVSENIDASLGSYQWLTPDTISENCRIRLSDMDEPVYADESNFVFGILVKSITVLSPSGGEEWPAGLSQNILWSSEFITGDVQIKYSTDNGVTWNMAKRWIADSLRMFEWTVPDELSDSCRIKILDLDDTEVYGESGGVFSIVDPSSIEKDLNNGISDFYLEQNYPNPFNPTTRIDFGISRTARVKINIYSVTGEKVMTPLDQNIEPGRYSIPVYVSILPAGVYFYTLEAGAVRLTKKCILLK